MIMRGLVYTIAMTAIATLLGGCSAMLNTTYGSSDLYRTNNRAQVTTEIEAREAALKARAEAYSATWEDIQNSGSDLSYSSIVADDYESAYARRLKGFNSPTYKLPSSYYSLSTRDAMRYATAYDPAYYNIMVSGDQVWVEPKYVTSMFGSWGATNISYGIYPTPWAYGWYGYADPFYYTWWGYPHYSWYDWNWTICYNPIYWGPGYYPGFYPYYPGYYPYYPGYYPYYPARPPHPHHPGINPGHRPGGGTNHNINGDRRNSASRYTSPTSNRNYGGGTNMNGGRSGRGATATGVYNSQGSSSNRGYYNGNSNSRSNTTTVRTSQGQNTQRNNNNSNFRQSNQSNYNTGSHTLRSGGGYSGGGGSTRTGGGTSSRR